VLAWTVTCPLPESVVEGIAIVPLIPPALGSVCVDADGETGKVAAAGIPLDVAGLPAADVPGDAGGIVPFDPPPHADRANPAIQQATTCCKVMRIVLSPKVERLAMLSSEQSRHQSVKCAKQICTNERLAELPGERPDYG
jgi:hypothetical protein